MADWGMWRGKSNKRSLTKQYLKKIYKMQEVQGA
jgi:hypothetical protein